MLCLLSAPLTVKSPVQVTSASQCCPLSISIRSGVLYSDALVPSSYKRCTVFSSVEVSVSRIWWRHLLGTLKCLLSFCSAVSAVCSMDKDSHSPSGASYATTSAHSQTLRMVGPPSPPPLRAPSSPQSHHQFGADFTSLYHSIFPQKFPYSDPVPSSPSPRSSASSSNEQQNACSNSSLTIEHHLQQASLVLEYQQLCESYELCRAHLHDLVEEIDSIRRENAALRLANKELVKLLSLSSQAAMHNCLRRLGLLEASGTRFDFAGDEFSGYSPTSVMDQGRFERRNTERVWLPKSISVRSSSYLKANRPANGSSDNSGSSRSANQLRVSSAQETERVTNFTSDILFSYLIPSFSSSLDQAYWPPFFSYGESAPSMIVL